MRKEEVLEGTQGCGSRLSLVVAGETERKNESKKKGRRK